MSSVVPRVSEEGPRSELMRPRFPDPFPKWNIRAQNGKFCPRSTTTVVSWDAKMRMKSRGGNLMKRPTEGNTTSIMKSRSGCAACG